ncbi:hypothetical protein BKA83DRAFT_4360944 [Pisolithus microcarpus]|nr:hypothetical protein BKA83DRAFT_4360944 [Pisolithus microcarpus]
MLSLWDATSLQNAFLAASLSLSLVVSFLVPAWRIPEFTPRQIIYAKDVFPLLLAPWAAHANDVTRSTSRLVQIALSLRLPQTAILPCYVYWIGIALARTLTGFLFTRSVGWAYPRLFNHWALYEISSGIGPPLATYLLTFGARPTLDFLRGSFKGRYWESGSRAEVLLVICTCIVLCWLDRAPWTYAMATLLSISLTIWRTLIASPSRDSTNVPFGGFDLQCSNNSPFLRRPRTSLQASALFLLIIPLPYILGFLFRLGYHPIPHIAPSSANFGRHHPLLEILVLSFPRPNDAGSTPVLSRTISSYLPYINNNGSTSLSVFTHAQLSHHPSFELAKKEFRDAPVVFHADRDSHPDEREGQYLHVAEAFRWVYERRQEDDIVPNRAPAEWIMLVEDDFPLCGEWGWRGIVGVMRMLEDNRAPSASMGRWGGFVGTGGSGLIIHRSVLPILTHVLRIHASLNSPLPHGIPRRPPDVIIQDCLLGTDPLCPAYNTFMSNSNGGSSSLVITSRLVMDHIGSDKSTAAGRAYSPEKWRCGWRHPFHGLQEVVVVPV